MHYKDQNMLMNHTGLYGNKELGKVDENRGKKKRNEREVEA